MNYEKATAIIQHITYNALGENFYGSYDKRSA